MIEFNVRYYRSWRDPVSHRRKSEGKYHRLSYAEAPSATQVKADVIANKPVGWTIIGWAPVVKGSRNPAHAGTMPAAPRVFFPVGTPVRFKVSKHTEWKYVGFGAGECGFMIRKDETGVVTEAGRKAVVVRPNRQEPPLDGDPDTVRIPWDEVMDTLVPLNIRGVRAKRQGK